MPSTYKGRPIHHYAGQPKKVLDEWGITEADQKEIWRRLKDPKVDRAVIQAQVTDPTAGEARAPQAPKAAAPEATETPEDPIEAAIAETQMRIEAEAENAPEPKRRRP